MKKALNLALLGCHSVDSAIWQKNAKGHYLKLRHFAASFYCFSTACQMAQLQESAQVYY
jgi:hypothetical protein